MRYVPRDGKSPLVPTPRLSAFAKDALAGARPFQLLDRTTGTLRELPEEVEDLLRQVYSALARDQAVSVVATDAELTTNQAANVLNVSRSFLVRQIEAGALPHRLVGKHRRVLLADVLKFRQSMFARAHEGLNELASIDESLGLDD